MLFLSISALVTTCVYGVYAIRLLIARRRESQAISQQVQVDSNHHRMALLLNNMIIQDEVIPFLPDTTRLQVNQLVQEFYSS